MKFILAGVVLLVSAYSFAEEALPNTDAKSALKKALEEGGITTYIVMVLAFVGVFYIISALKKR